MIRKLENCEFVNKYVCQSKGIPDDSYDGPTPWLVSYRISDSGSRIKGTGKATNRQIWFWVQQILRSTLDSDAMFVTRI